MLAPRSFTRLCVWGRGQGPSLAGQLGAAADGGGCSSSQGEILAQARDM